MHKMWHVIVEVRKSNPIFSSNRLPYYNLVNIVELIPIFIPEKNKNKNLKKKKKFQLTLGSYL